jgi:hypothetical protein
MTLQLKLQRFPCALAGSTVQASLSYVVLPLRGGALFDCDTSDSPWLVATTLLGDTRCFTQ